MESMKLYRIGIHDQILVFSKNPKNKTTYEGKDILTKLKCEIDKCDQKKWEEANPNWNESEKGTMEYISMVRTLTGGDQDSNLDSHNKIIKNVVKEVII